VVFRRNLVGNNCQHLHPFVHKRVISYQEVIYQFPLRFAHPVGKDHGRDTQVLGYQYIDIEFDNTAFAGKTRAFHQHKIESLFKGLICFDDPADNFIVLIPVLFTDYIASR